MHIVKDKKENNRYCSPKQQTKVGENIIFCSFTFLVIIHSQLCTARLLRTNYSLILLICSRSLYFFLLHSLLHFLLHALLYPLVHPSLCITLLCITIDNEALSIIISCFSTTLFLCFYHFHSSILNLFLSLALTLYSHLYSLTLI